MLKMIKASIAGHKLRSAVLLTIAVALVGFVVTQSAVEDVLDDLDSPELYEGPNDL